MLEKEDIQQLMEVLATKDDVREIRQDLNGLRESVQALTVAVDRLAKAVDDLHVEYAVIVTKVDRHEKWFRQVAEKLGIKLEY